MSRTTTIYSVKTRTKNIFEVREINANANVMKLHGLAAKDIRTLLKGGSACARSWLSQDDGRVTEGPTMQNASVVDSH